MKNFLYMTVAAIAALCSCSQDDIVSGKNDNNAQNAPVFTATIEGEGATRTMLANGTKVEWESDDEVAMSIYDINYAHRVIYSATPGENAITATLKIKQGETYPEEVEAVEMAVYPANTMELDSWGNCSLNFPATQVYGGDGKMTNIPMLYYNNDWNIPTSISFSNPTAVLAITVPYSQMTSVKSITVSSDLMMNGKVFIEGKNYYISNADTKTDDNSKITLDCYSKASQNVAIPEDGKTFYIAILPMNAALKASNSLILAEAYGYLQFDVTDGTVTKSMKTKEGVKISVERNKIYPITFADNQTPAGDPNLLAGEFSVSPTKKVKFTKSNLYWDGSAYQFEANQTAYPTAWNTSHVGLFFWNSYDEYKTTKNGYKPYDSSFGHFESWSTSDVFWCGEDHPLEVAGTQGLYVLSAEEWYYLTGIFTYASYSDVRNETNKFANAMVNGKIGLLIFPDGYNGTTKLTGITGIAEVNNDYTEYPTESIPTDTWSDMEAAGVVFLPAAGYRGDPNGQTITPGNCQYWSSTPYSVDKQYAYGLYGTDAGEFTCPGKIRRNYGSSIRLVKTVESTPAATSQQIELFTDGGTCDSNIFN